MDDEEDVDDDEEMVGVPKSIESRQSLQRFWEVQPAATKPRGGQCECYGHKHNHDDAGPAFRALNEPPVVVWSCVAKERLHGDVFFIAGMEEARKVAG